MAKQKRKKKIMIWIVVAVLAFLLSVAVQFGMNMRIKPIKQEDITVGDGLASLMMQYDNKYRKGIPVSEEIEKESYLMEQLDYTFQRIDGRYDCADFSANALIRFYLENEAYLPVPVKSEIKRSLTGFKYWMDQGGEDSLCMWSENHQILYAVTEYLAGQTFPDDVFADGNTGAEHMKIAAKRIEAWTSQRFYYGFNEYYSNNYYPEDIAPLSNFLQFADAKELKRQVEIAMDLIWFDIASQSRKYEEEGRTYYSFMSASGRMYFDNKSSDDTGNRLRNYVDFVMDNNEGTGWSEYCNYHFLCFRYACEAGAYKVPKAIKEIFENSGQEEIVLSSSGLTLEELKEKDLIGQRVDQIMMQMGMEAFSNAQVIDNSMAYLDKNEMFSNSFLNDFKLVNLWPLRLTHTLGAVSGLLNPCTNGKVIERGNVYTYKTPYYSMSTNQAYQPGEFGDQHQISLANISKEISVYTTQPMRNMNREQYWVGQGRMPYSVQERNVNLTIYRLPEKTAMLEPHIVKYTHAYFPVGLFDQVDTSYMDQGFIFAQKNDTYVMLRALGGDQFYFYPVTEEELQAMNIKSRVRDLLATADDYRYDLICEGGTEHAWITELSDIETDESFEKFIERMLANTAEFTQSKLFYESSQKQYEVSYDEYFKVNGEQVELEYQRFDSAYSKTAREAQEIVIACNGNKLILNYQQGKRVEE